MEIDLIQNTESIWRKE